jgi:hypothetical protein
MDPYRRLPIGTFFVPPMFHPTLVTERPSAYVCTKMVSGSILPDDVVFPILMQVQMYGDILQKKAVTVEYRRDSDQHKWCRGTVMREEKMMSFVYITYREGRSVTTRERVGWKSERIEP